MKSLKLKNGFNRNADADLLVRTSAILTSMTDNPHFPSPIPTLANVTETLNAYRTAVQKAQNRGLQEVAEKNDLKALLVGELHLLGNYVVFCAAGNAAIAMSSGFAVSGPRSARPALTAPEDLVLTNGLNRGELLLKLKRVPNVQSYRYEITAHPLNVESRWESVAGTVSKKLFTGLESGREYCCRVAAVGIKNQVVYSRVVNRIAL